MYVSVVGVCVGIDEYMSVEGVCVGVDHIKGTIYIA